MQLGAIIQKGEVFGISIAIEAERQGCSMYF
jgi:hypothetical protein